MSVQDAIASFFVLAGGLFIAISALGLVRLPDVYLRMHSVAKAGTLGCGLVLTGTAIGLPDAGVLLRVVGAIVFLLVTAPIASHLIGRAAHQNDAKMWDGTVLDQWDDPSDRPG